VSPTWI